MGKQRGECPNATCSLVHTCPFGVPGKPCPVLPCSAPRVASLEGVPPQLDQRQDSSQELASLVMPLGKQVCHHQGTQDGLFLMAVFSPCRKSHPTS